MLDPYRFSGLGKHQSPYWKCRFPGPTFRGLQSGWDEAGKSRDLTPENSKSLQAYPQLFRLKILQFTGSKVKVLFPRFCSNSKCSHEVMKIRGSTVSELNCLSEKQTQIYFSDFRSQGLINTLNPPSLSYHVLSQALNFFAIKRGS